MIEKQKYQILCTVASTGETIRLECNKETTADKLRYLLRLDPDFKLVSLVKNVSQVFDRTDYDRDEDTRPIEPIVYPKSLSSAVPLADPEWEEELRRLAFSREAMEAVETLTSLCDKPSQAFKPKAQSHVSPSSSSSSAPCTPPPKSKSSRISNEPPAIVPKSKHAEETEDTELESDGYYRTRSGRLVKRAFTVPQPVFDSPKKTATATTTKSLSKNDAEDDEDYSDMPDLVSVDSISPTSSPSWNQESDLRLFFRKYKPICSQYSERSLCLVPTVYMPQNVRQSLSVIVDENLHSPLYYNSGLTTPGWITSIRNESVLRKMSDLIE